MKYLIVCFLMAIVACGGGSNTEEVPQGGSGVKIDQPKAIAFTITEKAAGLTYTGLGGFVDSVAYTSPQTIANSSYVVNGEIAITQFSLNGDMSVEATLYSYFERSRVLVTRFDLTHQDKRWTGENNEYSVIFERLTVEDIDSIESLPESFTPTGSAGVFGDPVLYLTRSGKNLLGDDDQGCLMQGDVYLAGDAYGLNLTVSGCNYNGVYSGSLIKTSNQLIGGAANGDFFIKMNFKVE